MRQPPSDICGYAQDAQRAYRIPASVQLAQWIIESGWGAHSPGNNPFGMKPRRGKNDPSQQLVTSEFIKGKRVKLLQPFRVFPSVRDAFIAHAALIATAPVYAYAMSKLPNEDEFINAMAPRYATDPAYGSKLKSLIKSQGLEQFNV